MVWNLKYLLKVTSPLQKNWWYDHSKQSPRIEDNELLVKLVTAKYPISSQKGISKETEIIEESVQQILKQSHFHGYHIQLYVRQADFGS